MYQSKTYIVIYTYEKYIHMYQSKNLHCYEVLNYIHMKSTYVSKQRPVLLSINYIHTYEMYIPKRRLVSLHL